MGRKHTTLDRNLFTQTTTFSKNVCKTSHDLSHAKLHWMSEERGGGYHF